MLLFFFFQAEDGIRDVAVTGVQTCALPISPDTKKTSPNPTIPNANTTPPSAAISPSTNKEIRAPSVPTATRTNQIPVRRAEDQGVSFRQSTASASPSGDREINPFNGHNVRKPMANSRYFWRIT